jgi:DNA-dependent RNA polymerase auxiliary subunit epsilon
MIAKTQLQSIIAKYFLGEIEQIKWEIKDNHLNINFITPSNMVLGSVKCNDFQMEDAELAIYNTKKLANLISICSGDLMLDLDRQKEIITKLKIADENFNLEYALSDPLLIKKVGTAKPVDSWYVEIDLGTEEIGNILRAKGAMSEVEHFLVTTTKDLDKQDICEFIFGDEIGHNNKISYQMQGMINKEYMKIKYNSNMMKTILNANKDMDEGKFKISNAGLMYLHFTDGVIESEYYMVPTEDGIIS